MSSEHDNNGRKYLAPRMGTVSDNADPRGIGRVRVRIPGLCEPASGWALPFGVPGGGTAQRGFYDPPDIGAEVVVLFVEGDIDRPIYSPAQWGDTASGKETPGSAATEHDPAEAPKVKAYETSRYKFEFDLRTGKERMVFVDKVGGDMLEFDGVARAITIQATTSLSIKALGVIQIQATTITLNGRVVAPTGTPID